MKTITIFAGAGCSMSEPSSLPGWNDMNDAILISLWNRMADYYLPELIWDKVLQKIQEKRKTHAFPPDYQAQVMVERVGNKYFELLSAVDTNIYNPIQYYTSILSKAGIVGAIITTNFDRNFERALTEVNMPYSVFFDKRGFDTFLANFNNETIPILKIHGCCSDPNSMIDTRKQRLKGRAQSLKKSIIELIKRDHFLFAGFSGQDFDENKFYLGFRDAAHMAKGFTYLQMPGGEVRASMKELIEVYGRHKAKPLICDPAVYLEDLVKESGIKYDPFPKEASNNHPFSERLEKKIAALSPMDAANMLFGLIESYGDEAIARYLYDRVWEGRKRSDYHEDSLSRFLLNYGRTYAFNFQTIKERSRSIETDIIGIPIDENNKETIEEEVIDPDSSKKNLLNTKNTSPETVALIGLVQTYIGDPILFSDFPDSLANKFKLAPNKTELADIIFYYSYYALIYNDSNILNLLNEVIQTMESDFDEPRLSQLLSRKAIVQLRDERGRFIEQGGKDAIRANNLARIYHEPHLIALSSLTLSIFYRKNNDFENALQNIEVAERNYIELKRIPLYVESVIEFLKVIILGFNMDYTDKELLLNKTIEIKDNINQYVVNKINGFEPEYCYLMGLILREYTDAPKEIWLYYFVDAVSLTFQFKNEVQSNFYQETCRQLQILDEVNDIISKSRWEHNR